MRSLVCYLRIFHSYGDPTTCRWSAANVYLYSAQGRLNSEGFFLVSSEGPVSMSRMDLNRRRKGKLLNLRLQADALTTASRRRQEV